ncbi:MAG: CpsB/CapC family capsule biosynthesis tyrosine phosphatase [Paenibacillaceae bacterium]
MIDLHSHILPGIDDGARTLEDSIEMAQLAVKDGIRLLAATPHHNNGRFSNEGIVVKQAIDSLNQELSRQNIPLKVLPGHEIRINDLFWEECKAGNLLTLNDSRYMLIELPNQHVPRDIWDVIHELKLKGIVPIIAHPERNSDLANEMDVLMELVEAGALSQVTTHSLNGLFGSRIRHIAMKMCQRRLVHIVASDAHNADHRPFGMREAYDLINRKLGKSYVQYYQNNARAVIDNQLMDTWEPRTEKRWYQRW